MAVVGGAKTTRPFYGNYSLNRTNVAGLGFRSQHHPCFNDIRNFTYLTRLLYQENHVRGLISYSMHRNSVTLQTSHAICVCPSPDKEHIAAKTLQLSTTSKYRVIPIIPSPVACPRRTARV